MRLRCSLPTLWVVGSFLILAARGRAAATPAIENNFTDDAAAQAVWRPMAGSAPAGVAPGPDGTVVRLPCNFSGTKFERASWDRAVQLDLAASRGVQFDFYCADAAPIGQFSLYFQSGDGWYAGSFQPETIGAWGTVTVNKAAMRAEGRPAGWDRITTLRVSAWRGEDKDTELRLGAFRRTGVPGRDASVAILRAESRVAGAPEEARNLARFVTTVVEGFEAYGLGCATPADLGLTAAQLQGVKLLVLPYNSTLPAAAVGAIRAFLRDGGRLLAFYQLPRELQAELGIEAGRLLKAADRPGGFAAIRVTAGALPGAPAEVKQRSWNIQAARPAGAEGRVVAEWLDDGGRSTGQAAIIATPNCLLMTHVLLNDDRANQHRLLLAMAGALVPELWTQAATAAVDKIGRIGGSRDFATTAAQIRNAAGTNRAAATALAEAQAGRDAAVALQAQGRPAEAIARAIAAAQRMVEAYCRVQRAPAGEFRAFWCHSAFGVEGLSWDEAIRRLADAGFTAIFPNLLWGGVAYYPSRVLPVAPEVATRGDQLAECLAAGRKYGVEVHVWKVNFNAGQRAPKEFLERMRREQRLQVSAKGKEEPWLCPSHPENQALEVAAMVEVAQEYGVDGVHFDYIRYPGGDHCFCGGCRERFGRSVGEAIARWPGDALAGGRWREAWLEWRRANISAVVQAVRERTRAVRPAVKVSAAVFRNWTTDRDGVGQDWKTWCDRGWLDFVCPMDYTGSARQFETWVTRQKEWAGRTPVYPGIGVSSSSSRLAVDQVIAQIETARRHATGGFILFNYGRAEAGELVPLLGLGATAKPK